MKLVPDRSSGVLLITARETDALFVNGERHASSLILMPDQLRPWACRDFSAIRVADVQALADLAPALVLLGTGERQRFLPAPILRPLIDAGIGFELMDSAAACRTYNLLASEGRRVLAALLLEP